MSDIIKQILKKTNYVLDENIKKLGSGSDGEIYEIKFKGSKRVLAAKLIKKVNEKTKEKLEIIQNLRGYNIIHNPFDELLGDNLLRFYCKQIVESLELLNRNNLVHFDIKPENILITINLIAKLSDFSLLTKIKEGQSSEIPGGTTGYVSREYYDKQKIPIENLRKQDYFSLGSTLFYLKYGEIMLDYDKYDDPLMNKDRITDLLHKKMDFIKSRNFEENDFIKFLLSLIQYNPNERPIFEQIYRNNWLNRNLDVIKSVVLGNVADEEKLIMELQKSDFLKMKEYEKKEKITTHKKFVFKFKKKRNNKLFHPFFK